MFRHVAIHTTSEGEVSELHVGLKGTMGALYLQDLAAKTRRGLEGRIRAGRSIGAPPYCYEVVRKLGDDGELDRGSRDIDPVRAAIVQRIFRAYAGGASPRRIARGLNAEDLTGPGGGIWFDSSILARPKRGDGLLRNELYIGRLVWRRRVNANDPVSGAKLRRHASAADNVVRELTHLRIIDDGLWQRVQLKLVAEAAPVKASAGRQASAFWDRRRPRHLLSGMVVCGVCSRRLSVFGQDHLGCMASAHGTCRNKSRVRRGALEAQVMNALGRQLMQPELVAEFIAAFNDEWRRLAGAVNAQAVTHQPELPGIDRKIANLIEEIGDGRSSPAILAKLAELEGQKAKLNG